MSPFDELEQRLRSYFERSEILVRRAEGEGNVSFLNLRQGTFEIAVEWTPGSPFGISSFDDPDDLEGLFEPPDEWVKNPEAAFHYIVSLAIERRVTKAKLVTIAQIRQERGLSQEAVSARLDITQATYSKMERREELLVSSVVKIIRAFGGVTRIRFFFNDTHDARDLVLR